MSRIRDYAEGFVRTINFSPIIEGGTQQVDEFLLSAECAIGRELILGSSYREIIRRYCKYLSLGSEDIPIALVGQIPHVECDHDPKELLCRGFPLAGGSHSRPLAVSRRASMRLSRSPLVIASCRAWFTASALRVENGFFLPGGVGLGGRGISSTSSSVWSGVGFASPQWGCICCLWVSW